MSQQRLLSARFWLGLALLLCVAVAHAEPPAVGLLRLVNSKDDAAKLAQELASVDLDDDSSPKINALWKQFKDSYGKDYKADKVWCAEKKTNTNTQSSTLPICVMCTTQMTC